MKQIIPILTALYLLLVLSLKSYSQPRNIPVTLKQKLQGKTNLTEIMKVVDKYYTQEEGQERNFTDGDEEEEGTPYQQWKRWEWWMSSHLDGNGKFVSIPKSNNKALFDINNKWQGVIDAATSTLQRNATFTVERERNEANNPNSPNNIELAYGDWALVGPTAEGSTVTGDIKGIGRFDRIAFHPTNANIIYVGSPTGNLWKTTDGGTTWASVTDGLTNPGVAGIAISPTNGNVIYILTGDGDSYNPGYLVYDYGSSRASSGVYKSTDGGTTWTQTGALFTGGDYEGHRLRVSPTNGNYLFATTSQGIYRTIDGGTTWTQVKSGEHWDIEFKPGNDSVVYATSGSGIFYSTGGGRSGTWNTSTTDFSVASARRIELAVSANNANYVYALCGAAGSGTFTGIFRSTNSGVDYTRRTNTPNILNSSTTGAGTGEQSDYDLGICVKPNNAEIIATCGLCVWRSNGANGGTTMVSSTIYRESFGAASAYIHPDVHDVQYNPLNNNLYAASDGGFYRSTDDGVTWTNLSAGLSTSQFYGMTIRDTDGDGDADGLQILAGAQDNGIKYRPSSGSSIFNHVICCDGYGVAASADNTNNIYYNINNGFYKSTDGGNNSTFILTSTFFSPIAIDYLDPDTVYLGGTSTRRSYNGFTTTNLTIGNNTRRVLTTCPSNQARLYGSSGSDVIRSDDRIATWATKSGTAGWPVGTFTINDIDVFPTNSLEVYVCFGGYSSGNKVMRSLNGGDTWTNWSGTLPNIPCYGLAVATEGVYVGTEFGVFFRGFTMTDWVPFYNQMPRTPVTELVVNDNGLIYASTFGRGIWLSNRRTACASLLTISGSRTGAYYYEAGNGISATITATGTNGDEIFAQAGDTVILKPGFEIKAGSYFKGYIAPCNNGGIPVATVSASQQEETITVPHITEIRPDKKTAFVKADYFRVTNETIEFNITKKGLLKMMIKEKDGTWKIFYPQDIIYPGLFSIPVPASSSKEYKILLNGVEMKEIK